MLISPGASEFCIGLILGDRLTIMLCLTNADSDMRLYVLLNCKKTFFSSGCIDIAYLWHGIFVKYHRVLTIESYRHIKNLHCLITDHDAWDSPFTIFLQIAFGIELQVETLRMLMSLLPRANLLEQFCHLLVLLVWELFCLVII